MMKTRHNGIAGLEPREPYGAVLSAGIKAGQYWTPDQKDRFHILEPLPHKIGKHLVRRHHPRFKAFNEAPPEFRRTVTCQLVHRTRDEAFLHHLMNYRVKGKPHHPAELPFCVGDGVRATRYMGVVGGEHRFDEIVCPHDKCEYRQSTKLPTGRDSPKACKPWMKMLFRLVWQKGNLPTTETLFTCKGWNTTKRAKGLFKNLHDKAAMVLGEGRAYSLGGYVFTMTLGQKTNRQQQSRFPVIDFSPVTDPIDFFEAQLSRGARALELLGPSSSAGLLEAHPERDAQEHLAHIPGVTRDV